MKSTRCKTCIISASFPGIELDQNGICNLCRNHAQITRKIKGEKTLERLFLRYRGQGDYDCMVAFSGGKDSTYVLYRLKKRYKLKILAVTGEDYLASPQAWENRFRVTQKLGIDHIIIRYDWNLYKEVYRATIVKSGMRPRAINLVHNVMHEKAIYEVLQRYKIPLLITGNSEDELECFQEWKRNLGFQSTGNDSYDYWNNWRNAYRKLFREILPHRLQKRIPEIVWAKPKENDSASTVKHVSFFRYEPFNVKKNIDVIEKKVGWVLPQDVGGTETDSAGLQFDVYLYRKLHSEEAYAAQISTLIRNETITRELAWKAFHYKDYTIVKRFFHNFRLSWKYLNPKKCTPFLGQWLDLFLPIR